MAGRKRFIAADSLGPVRAVLVATAGVRDRDGGRRLLGAARRWLPRAREVVADRGLSRRFQGFVRRVCRRRVVATGKPTGGFAVQPRRWVVERALGRLVGYRRPRLAYEHHPETSEAMIHAATIDLMVRRRCPAR